MVIPPETAAHADGFLVNGRSGVNSITTNQSSQRAASNVPFACDSVVEELGDVRHQLLLDEIQVSISFTTEFLTRVITVRVLVVSVVGVPDSNHNNLVNAASWNKRV